MNENFFYSVLPVMKHIIPFMSPRLPSAFFLSKPHEMRVINPSVFNSQGCNRRERLQQDEEGGQVVHLWVLQKAKGQYQTNMMLHVMSCRNYVCV